MFDFIFEFFWGIIIGLVGLIFQLVSYTYQVFLFLAETNIFNQSTYQSLTEKIYVILGVVMLFIIAYNFLTLVIDPDKNEKGQTIEKLLKNVVISFILIVLTPSIFNFAFQIQNSILTTNGGVINNFFSSSFKDLGEDDTINSGGRRMAVSTFRAFFVPTEGSYDLDSKTKNRSYKLPDGSSIDCRSSCTLDEAEAAAMATGSFAPYKAFSQNIVDDEVEFNWIIALIAGGYLVYVIVSFCFDLAVRACKLAFYQIIAPITISCRILPKQDDIFNKWMKATFKTYMGVFIRILIMNLGVYLISVFIQSDFFSACEDCSFGVTLIGYAFIILGIVTFIKMAPKLVDDIFNLNDDISLGIKEKLKAGGLFTGGAALGAGTTGMVKNASHAVKNISKAKGGKAKAAAAIKGIGSTVAGGVSGTARGFKAGKDAGSFTDMKGAASSAAQATVDARDKRESYRANASAGPIKGDMPIIGGIATTWEHMKDAKDSIKDWAGITGSVEALRAQKELYDQGMSFQKKLFELASDNETVLAYKGQHKNAQEREFKQDDYVADSSLPAGKQYVSKLDPTKRFATAREAMAHDVAANADEIKMYDDLIKLTSMKVVSEKLKKGEDGRYKAVVEEFKRFREKNSSDELIRGMNDIVQLTDAQINELNKAMMGLNPADVDATMKKFKKDVNLMANNEAFKIQSGEIANQISQKIAEEQKKDKK